MNNEIKIESIKQQINDLVLAGRLDEAQALYFRLSLHNPYTFPLYFEPISTWFRSRQSFRADVDAFRYVAQMNRGARRVIIAAMPKSGSTLLQKVILGKEGARKFVFDHMVSGMHLEASALGNNGQEQEIDESALWKACICYYDWVSQRHLRASKFSDAMMKYYHINIIVSIRNIFDCMISARDMFVKENWHQVAWVTVPPDFREMGESDQLDWLIFHYAPWYLTFYDRWVHSTSNKIFVHYSEWARFGTEGVVKKLSEFLALDADESQAFLASTIKIKDSKLKETRFNKGSHGRGKIFSKDHIDHVTRMATLTNKNLDWGPVLDFY